MILLTLALLSPASPSARVADLLPSSPVAQRITTRTYRGPLDAEVHPLELVKDLGLQPPSPKVSYYLKSRELFSNS
jgi:hypothetical protein